MYSRSGLMQVRAIIFDLDGTLADTEKLHFEAFNYVLRARGIELTKADYFSRLVGRNDHDCFALLLREHRVPANETRISELIAHKSAFIKRLSLSREPFSLARWNSYGAAQSDFRSRL